MGRSRVAHAAFYLGQVSDGIFIVDQCPGSGKEKISIRFIRKQRQNPDGTYANPSDNAEAFWVIE
ncbi:BPSL0067 family protein [Duganella aquatilis]|uniref:BPSL0067 family protein n=1 Tax=Duganella aquatilis TaxID=2666082 RepID=UPI003530ABBE